MHHPKVNMSNDFYARLRDGFARLERYEVDGALDDGDAIGVLEISEAGTWFEVKGYSVADALEAMESPAQPPRRELPMRRRFA